MRLTLTPPFISVAAAVDWLDRELPADCCWNVEAGRRQSSLHTRRDAARDGIIFSALACSPIHPRKTNGVVDHEPME